MKTVCIACKHFYNKEDGARTGVWYNQFCKAPPARKKKDVDPVSGKIGYVSKNDLGTVIYDDNPYPYVRNVNDGNCKFFDSLDIDFSATNKSLIDQIVAKGVRALRI